MTSTMNTDIKRLPTHPGEVLKEELEVRNISQKTFSVCTGISYTMLNEILNGKRPVTSDIALIMEAALGISAELLVEMQSRYNIIQSRMKPNMKQQLEEVRKMCASWLV